MFSPYDLTADHFVAFVSEQRALIDEARRGSSTAREKLCSLVYVIARIQLHEGMPGDEIRTRLLEQSSETIGALTFDQGPRIADVAQAIEDALARRPPKYPQWINLAALADLEPRDKPAV